MKLSNNKILITGGASGIGLGLTERFIKENNTVIICGRREEKLKVVRDKFRSVNYITGFLKITADGKNELTFGFSEVMAKANPDAITATFNRMNP
jgi:uncharacterized oxidoreductase